MTSPAVAQDKKDLRRAQRQRVLLGGKVVYADGRFTVDCVFRNLSPNGAMIKLPDGQIVPDHFQLIEMRNGMAYDCQVAWREYPLMGVQFTGQTALLDADTPHMRHLKRLWLDAQMR